MTATNIWYLIFGTDTARFFNFGALSKTLSSHFSWFFFFVIGGRWYYPWIAASVLSEFLSGCILCVFQAWRWQKFRQIRWISWKSFSTNFSVARELWKDAAPLNGKTFSSTISFSRTSIKRRYIFFDFSQLRYFPDFYVLFPIASINLNPRIEIGVTVRHSVIPLSLYIPRVSRHRYIFRIYFRGVGDYADRFRLSSPIRSLARRTSPVKEFARNEKMLQKKKNMPFPTYTLFLRFSFFSTFLASLGFSRFAPSDATIFCPWHGRTFNFNHRPGNYKSCSRSSYARGRFQLRISVSLGAIGREERTRTRKIGEEFFRLHVVSCSSYSPGRTNRGCTTCELFSN